MSITELIRYMKATVQVFTFPIDTCKTQTHPFSHAQTHTHTNTCLAITILTLPAAQLRRVSVSASRLTLVSTIVRISSE